MSTVSANPGAETLRWDIFLCYAREDKKKIVEPLYRELTVAGIACWYDQTEIRWGDPTAGKIMEGLSASRHVIVILTSDFLKKHYGRFELLTSINDEASTGKVKVLPLLCGTQDEREEILRKLPIVSGKHCLHWDGTPQQVIDALRERLSADTIGLPAGDPNDILPLVIGGTRQRAKRWVTYSLLLALAVALVALLPWLLKGRPPVKHLPEMVLIEGGAFQIGVNPDEAKQLQGIQPEFDEDLFEDAAPRHEVYVDSFYISKTEVTNEQYESFLADNPGRGNLRGAEANKPVTMVSWRDAGAYCQWLSGETGLKYRLPTEAEWEKAARGSSGRRYPWGDAPPPDAEHANFGKSQLGDSTMPVGSRPSGATPVYGLLDMAGNVAEWCSDWYGPDYYKSGESKNPEGPQEGERRVVRGGSSKDGIFRMHCAVRHSHPPATSRPDLGFRVVREP